MWGHSAGSSGGMAPRSSETCSRGCMAGVWPGGRATRARRLHGNPFSSAQQAHTCTDSVLRGCGANKTDDGAFFGAECVHLSVVHVGRAKTGPRRRRGAAWGPPGTPAAQNPYQSQRQTRHGPTHGHTAGCAAPFAPKLGTRRVHMRTNTPTRRHAATARPFVAPAPLDNHGVLCNGLGPFRGTRRAACRHQCMEHTHTHTQGWGAEEAAETRHTPANCGLRVQVGTECVGVCESWVQ